MYGIFEDEDAGVLTFEPPLIRERSLTHGDFTVTAGVAHQLKDVFRTGRNWQALNNTQREALDMVASKIGRILSGNHNYADHWDDASAYLTLAKTGEKSDA